MDERNQVKEIKEEIIVLLNKISSKLNEMEY
jgi:hypothetical protein